MTRQAADFQLYDTYTRSLQPFVPLEPGIIKLYVCGMTVYDDAHVGHARAMVVFDALVRSLRHRGWQVRFVRNFTDIDDKIIARAQHRDENPLQLAEQYIARFREDCTALGLTPPDVEPRVTEHMPAIVAFIKRLLSGGHAYVAEGSVWFSVRSFADYGKLSGCRTDEVRSADSAVGKRAPQDFALWKAAKPGEPSWPSPWGEGRPGWHVECSAMAHAHLGEQMDIHGGGQDLCFPHHENEIAQSECALGVKYARYWLHNGLLTMQSGQKMGKSLGNVFSIRDALALFPAEALRLYYLLAHYRSPLPWGEGSLEGALAQLSRLYEAKEQAQNLAGNHSWQQLHELYGEPASTLASCLETFFDRYDAALAEDFNTAKALGYVFEVARALNRFAGEKKVGKRGGLAGEQVLRAFAHVSASLGLLALDIDAFWHEVQTKRMPALGLHLTDVEAVLKERADARQAKDFARADALRRDLDAKGIEVRDTPAGATWRVRLTATRGSDDVGA